MKEKFAAFFRECATLLRSVPPLTFCFFVLAVVAMNLLANKSLNLPVDWLALDCGIIVSWVAFLCMDVLTKHFGPKAATIISVTAIVVNLFLCLIFFLAKLIPGTWGAFYDFGENPVINEALDSTFGGTWYVVLGSTVAFVASAVINNFTNFAVGKIFKKKPDGFGAYACRTYVSTAIGQFADNLIFALIVSLKFFGWSLPQCLTCAATGMVVELLLELVFSPIGYRVCKRWEKRGVGAEYFSLLKSKNSDMGAEI